MKRIFFISLMCLIFFNIPVYAEDLPDLPEDYDGTFCYVEKPITKDSKKILIEVTNPIKGAILKVKIGKKTFKKRLTNTKHHVRVKIKKPEYGKKIKVHLYYKGERIDGEIDYIYDVVYYAKKIRKGMTTKQAKYTIDWYYPHDTYSYSNGYTYWWYDGGSYIVFKNGRVKRWRDVS